MIPQILLFRNGGGAMSKAIQWQTDSPYSHAALAITPVTIIEAWAGEGVRRRLFTDYASVDVFRVEMDLNQADKVVEFATQQLGKGYDWWGCARFISRRNLPDNDKWFCSELVFASFLFAGIHLLERVEAEQVSPGLLSHSPLLIPA